MTPSQESTLKEVHDICLKMDGRFDLIDERIKTNREFILEHEQLHILKQKQLDSLNGDKRFVMGAIWVFGCTGFLGACAFIVNLFIK